MVWIIRHMKHFHFFRYKKRLCSNAEGRKLCPRIWVQKFLSKRLFFFIVFFCWISTMCKQVFGNVFLQNKICLTVEVWLRTSQPLIIHVFVCVVAVLVLLTHAFSSACTCIGGTKNTHTSAWIKGTNTQCIPRIVVLIFYLEWVVMNIKMYFVGCFFF